MADSFSLRLIGLMGKRDLSNAFLLIPRCTSVHTCFMRGPIDLVFLDPAQQVLSVDERARPWRFFFGPRGAASVLELPAGYTRERGISLGDTIQCQSD